MSIKRITTDELRCMVGKEGLVLQGCGGDLDEWVNGINKMLTDEGILKDGSRFENCLVFEHEDLTCIFYPFDGVKLDGGKLITWRIRTSEQFGGMWLSDYVPEKLGGFIHPEKEQTAERKKPNCPLIGEDGNIFNLMGIASRTLRQNGMSDEATEMCDRIRASGDYYKALGIIGEYVNITSSDDPDEGFEQSESISMK